MDSSLKKYVESMNPEEKRLIEHLFTNYHDRTCDECIIASSIARKDKVINGIISNILRMYK